MSAKVVQEYMSDQRQTGRSTRLMDQARDYLKMHHEVILVAANETQAKHFREALFPIVVGITVKTIDEIQPVDWVRMRSMYDQLPNVYLFDHQVIEEQLAAAIEMLHRYDLDI